MASAVASVEVPPKPVFLMDILASPSACGKTDASARHVFSTGGAPPRSSSDGVKDSTGKDAAADAAPPRERDLSIPKLFTGGVLDLFPEAAMRDLLLALAEDGGAASASMTGFSPRGWWVSKEVGDAVQLKVAMPGLGKEHVKMRAEKNVLVIKGEGDKDSEGDDDKVTARYTYRIGLSSQAFKMDQIKAEMKNGVLMVTVPKIKDEERKDVFEIKIE
ncbi:unnamed protein product [Miscanthus lutarioriparius]|uniref:SHSP domain-containing protein n=1 Tax=Miscanthus lutarioriparius TaxID=422564 RepID=A0A811S8C9_9POAL|nr:unnamed protein product [Miscanthus lutarioriparius]